MRPIRMTSSTIRNSVQMFQIDLAVGGSSGGGVGAGGASPVIAVPSGASVLTASPIYLLVTLKTE